MNRRLGMTFLFVAMMVVVASGSRAVDAAADQTTIVVDPESDLAQNHSTARTLQNSPEQLEWTTAELELPKVLNGSGAAFWNGRLYITGGNSGTFQTGSRDVYFSELDADGNLLGWTSTTQLPEVRWGHHSVAINGQMFVIGGYPLPNSSAIVRRATILANGELGAQWIADPQEQFPPALYRTAVVARDTDIYVIGGYADNMPTNPRSDVFRARVDTDGSLIVPSGSSTAWQTENALPVAIHAHSAAVLNDYIYVTGGMTSLTTGFISDVYAARIYPDGSLGPWVNVQSLPMPMASLETVAYQGRLLIMGGTSSGSNQLDTVYSATPGVAGALGGWNTLTPLPEVRVGHTVVNQFDILYSVGGGDRVDIFMGKVPEDNGKTTRISVPSSGAQGNNASRESAMSGDGRFVVFESFASNLVPDDTNGMFDIFVHDRQTKATTRVSVDSSAVQGNNNSRHPTISADGRFVAFTSDSSNLVPNDTNGSADVFVHDRQNGTTSRISLASSGAQGNSDSFYPSISADGGYVAFESRAANFVYGDCCGSSDVFVHDRQIGTTIRISVDPEGYGGNDSSGTPSISADGQFVSFYSQASNLVIGDTNGTGDVFVHDLQTGKNSLVSVNSSGVQGNASSGDHAISANGRFVTFTSSSSNLVAGDNNGHNDIFVHDRETKATTRVSLSSHGYEGNEGSFYPTISADGRFVAFWSGASNLVLDDTNGWYDTFLHDRQTGMTTRVSVDSSGAQGDYESAWRKPAISSDGRIVAFTSNASNLVSNDSNNSRDVFVHDRGLGSGSVLGSSTVAPFLQLPVNYPQSGKFVLKDTDEGGRIDSWFDHSYPDRTGGHGFTLYSGDTLTETVTFKGQTCFKPLSPSTGVNQYCYDGHGGVDFQRITGADPILAAAAGNVVDTKTGCVAGNTGSGCGYGNYVLLQHYQGYFTRYSHMASVSVSANASVEAGQPIGIMGNTGDSDGTHLDFMVYRDVNDNDTWEEGVDKPVDPFGYFVHGASTPEADPWVKDRNGTLSYPLWIDLPTSGTTFQGNDGGQIANSDGSITAEIPPAYYDNAVVSIGMNNNPPPSGILESLKRAGQWFWLRLTEYIPLGGSSAQTRTSASTDAPITLVIEYQDTLLSHLDEDALQLARWDEAGSAWLPLPTTIDKVNKTLTADTTELGAFDVQAPLLCPADVTEPDDNDKSAIELAPGATAAERLFDGELDEDWFAFTAIGGSQYELIVSGDINVSAEIELRDANGETVLANGVDILTWISPVDGWYTLRVMPVVGSNTGCSASYTVLLEEGGAPNNPPSAPANASPANAATNVAVAVGLSWTSTDPDNDPLTYEVRFGTTNSPLQVVASQSDTTYDPIGDLANSTTYYWQIIASDGQGGVTPGPVWSFTVASPELYTISGNVSEDISFPLEGALVTDSSGAETYTDENGDYVLTGLQAGVHEVEVFYNDYEFANNPATVTLPPDAVDIDFIGTFVGLNVLLIEPMADAYVDEASKTANFGTKPYLRVKNTTVDNTTYLMFEVSGLSCAAIESVGLSLFTKDPGPDGGSVYSTGINWTETGITWNNAPAISGTTLGNFGAVVDESWEHVSLTNAVTGDGIYSFAIRNNSSNLVEYSSKEGTYPGWLQIEYRLLPVVVPSADFLADHTSGLSPLTVNFQDISTGCPTGWLWDFGDGTTSTAQHPSHEYAGPGTYEVSLTVSNAKGSDTETKTGYITVNPTPPEPDYFISPSGSATIGGIPSTPADILRYDKATNQWTMVYDGSVRGTTKNISAFDILDDGSLLLVFSANQTIAGLGTATPYDVVKFTPNTPGVYPLGTGTFSWFFQSKPLGLTTSGEKIDAMHLSGDRLLLSTTGTAKIPLPPSGTLSAPDEDVFAFNMTTSQWETALVIDGSLIPGMGGEDLASIWDDPDSADYYITITGSFNLGGVKGNGKSIVKLAPNGGATVFTPSLVPWLAPGATFPSNLDGLALRN